VRLDGVERVARPHLLAADHERHLEVLRLELREPHAQLLALGAPGRVGADGLVVRFRDARDSVGAHAVDSRSARAGGARESDCPGKGGARHAPRARHQTDPGSDAVPGTLRVPGTRSPGAGHRIVWCPARPAAVPGTAFPDGAAPRIAGMAVTHVAYEVEDWGVGELWLEGSRVVWHDLPHASHTGQVTDSHLELVERLRAYFAGDAVTFDDVELDLEYETPFLERCA